jgi:hypothetical protein
VVTVARPCWNGAVWLEGAKSFETIVFASAAESFERLELYYGGVEVDVVSDMFDWRVD